MCKQSTEKIGYRDVFSQKEYVKMMLAELVNRLGDSIDAIAFTWLVYELTENPAWSALIYGVNNVPTILVTPFAGAWVEGRNKKSIMIWTDLGRAICVAFVATSYLAGILQPWMLFVTTVLISTLEAFRCPAGTAMIPKILEEKYYEYGMSLDTSMARVIGIIGTAAAGGIVATIGVSGAIYIDVATFLISALIIMMINSKEEKGVTQKFQGKEYLQSLSDGIKYVRDSKVFIFFIAVCLLINALMTPFNSLQAPLTSEVLGTGAAMLSVISIAAMAGSMIGAITYPWLKRYLSPRMLFGICGIGVCFYNIGLPACMPFYDNIVFTYCYVGVTTGLLGCFVAWLSTFMNVEFIKKVDEEYLARASGILTASNVASMPIMSFLISIIIGFTDTATIFMGTGILAGIACLLMLRSKQLDIEIRN